MADQKPDPEKADSVEMRKDGCLRKNIPENLFGEGFEKLGLIEEEMGKVKLEKSSDEVTVSSANGGGKSGVAGDEIQASTVEPVIVRGNEIMAANVKDTKICETMSGETVGIDESGKKSSEISTVGVFGVKSDKVETDEDGNGTSSNSKSESSSSSSTSSGSQEEEDSEEEDVEEEEEGEGAEEQGKVELEGEVDMEEGEIRDSDVEKMVAWSDDEYDEDGGGTKGGPIKSKNELKDLPPVPPVNVTLQPHHQTLPVGVISSIIGAQVIVEGVEQHCPLNEGTILWITESRSPIGLVDEIFGPVKSPYYIIRYNSENEVPAGIKQGTNISFVPEFANHVLKDDSSLYKKGYDASGENDEELSDEAEFSDDEEEAEYRKMRKMKKRGTNEYRNGNNKMDRGKNFKNRGATVQNNQFPKKPYVPEGVPQVATNLNQQQCTPSLTTLLNIGNSPNSSGLDQNMNSTPGFVSPYPQLVPPPGFIPPVNVVWTNGMPFQQQGMVFPNGMPWPQQNPLPHGFPLPQQFVPGQSLPPPNVVFQGAQSNFCAAAPSFGPWPGSFNQNTQNQPFGMGLQCQQQATMPPTNVSEHLLPPFPGNTEVAQNFNRGTYQGRDRKPNHRGGGQFRGGRGRQQPK